MKRRMIWIFLTGALVGIVLSGLYKHFVTDQIMDGGNGMENPDQNLFLLDGDGTYVDNSLLWPVLEGTWESPEDGWQAIISEESGSNGHAATVGLTLGKAVIVGAAGAVQRLKDGAMVSVDCARGVVQTLPQ